MSYAEIEIYEGISNRQVAKSILLHVGIVLLFSVSTYLFPNEDLVLDNAIRVDIVGLPEKLKHLPPESALKELAKPSKTTESKLQEPSAPKPSTAANPALDKKATELERKREQQKALEKLKALEALAELEESTQKEEQKEGAVAGNIQSSGNALTGIRQNQISSYLSQIQKHVKDNWNNPKWMAEARLKAQALVQIDSNGVVIRRSILKSSGNQSFDDSILTAIDNSSPFPVPPSALVGVFKNKGFTLGFPE